MKKIRAEIVCFAIFLGVFLTSCGDVREHKVAVIRVEYADGNDEASPAIQPILPSREEYEQVFFGEGDIGRTTKAGKKVFGSVHQFHFLQSGGLEVIKGHVLSVIVRPSETVKSILENEFLWRSDATQGKWWVANVIDSTLQELERMKMRGELSSEDQNALNDTDSRVFLFNDRHIGGGWSVNGNVVVPAMDVDGDVGPLGLYTHELGHALLDQPDRYWESLGGIASWDNMASSYSEFPALFSTLGRIDAGWASWGQSLAERGSLEAVPLSETTSVPSVVNELLPQPGTSRERLLFEVRRSAFDWETDLENPRPGVLLGSYDPQGYGLYDGAHESQRAMFQYRRPRVNHLDWIEGRTPVPYMDLGPETWSVPDATFSSGEWKSPWTCENGTLLNALGECLWSVEVRNQEGDLGGVEVRAQPRFQSKIFREREGVIQIDPEVRWPLRFVIEASSAITWSVEDDSGQIRTFDVSEEELDRANGRFRWDLNPKYEGRTIRFQVQGETRSAPYVRVAWAERVGVHSIAPQFGVIFKTWTVDSKLWVGGLRFGLSDRSFYTLFEIPERTDSHDFGFVRAFFLVRQKPETVEAEDKNQLYLGVAGGTFSSLILKEQGASTLVVEKRVEMGRSNRFQATIVRPSEGLDVVLHQLEWISADELPELSTPF